MKRGRKRLSGAEKAAKEAFRVAVLALGDCVMCESGDECEGPMDPHHIIRAQMLERYGRYVLRLDESELWDFVYDPRIGVPLRRGHHDLVTRAMRKLHARQLRAENFEFVREHGLELMLERELHWRPKVPLAMGARR